MFKIVGLEKKIELIDTEMKLKSVIIGEDMVRFSKESSGKKFIGSVQFEVYINVMLLDIFNRIGQCIVCFISKGCVGFYYYKSFIF